MRDASPSLKDISRKAVIKTSDQQPGKTWKGLNQYDDSASQLFEEALSAGGSSTKQALRDINAQEQGLRYKKRQEIFRTIPGAKLNKTFMKKKVLKNILMPYYRSHYESMEWAYTNYHCLNFFVYCLIH